MHQPVGDNNASLGTLDQASKKAQELSLDPAYRSATVYDSKSWNGRTVEKWVNGTKVDTIMQRIKRKIGEV